MPEAASSQPVVYQYQRALDAFRRGGGPAPLLKRMSELISLLDLSTTLSSSLSREEILEAALLIVMGEMGATRGALFVRTGEGAFELRAARGLSAPRGALAPLGAVAVDEVVLRGSGRHADVFDAFALDVLCPIVKAEHPIAVLGLGGRLDGSGFGPDDAAFLRSVAACAATPIENGLIYEELRRLNQRLSVKVYQLNGLFDISRELTASFDEEAIKNLTLTTLMGHLMVSRSALYLAGPGGLLLAHQRGLRPGDEPALVPEAEARPVLDALTGPRATGELPPGRLRDRLAGARLAWLVPLAAGERVAGFFAVGERAAGTPFTEEDRDFAQTLGRQCLAALQSVRLHHMQVEQQRRDREMQIARDIQQSLFPKCCPDVPGFEIAAESHSCYQVGGDYYDFIPLGGGRWAFAVADVSGKGTPASILMASVHASLQALAGTAPAVVVLERLNRFLFANTLPNRFVTMFYAELDPAARRLEYATAGHVPPYLVRADGRCERLTAGGPVLGLLEDAAFETGTVRLAAGDLVAAVTDGVTEALSPEEAEFGDRRTIEALGGAAPLGAERTMRALVDAVEAWTGPAGCSDDLTVLVLRGR